MKRRLVLSTIILSAFASAAPPLPPPRKPKLVLAITVDQFRYDYLLRFRSEYTAGLKRLLDQGAVFDDAHYIHVPTVTAVGHSTILSGATPMMSGIVANEWYDRALGKNVTSVTDSKTKLLGTSVATDGSSPRRLLVSTVGDEIKMSGQESRVIGVSIKDRSAILPVGHMADGAYWFDNKSGHWVTSTYYKDAMPAWVDKINEGKPAAKAETADWMPLISKPGAKPFCNMAAAKGDIPKCRSLEASPWGNEMIEDFAEQALLAEKMGQHNGTDILSVSFSSNDYVGHAMGPDSPEVHDITLRTDRVIGKLFDAVEKSVGMANVVVFLTADHGVSPVPEESAARKMPGGRNITAALSQALEEGLTAKYGAGKWIVGREGWQPYFNLELIASKKLDEADVQRTAAAIARRQPHVFNVFTSQQLLNGPMPGGPVATGVQNGFFYGRSPDLTIIQDPFYLFSTATEATGTSHGSPFNYDTHVPVVFMGTGIKAGHYFQRVAVNDIAPTVSAIVGVQEPSGSVGRVLQEMWQ
ncbi:MAG: type phosphodiesterase/nucleotide pyrophosphatase [Bryobacterales bacterium]|nr:type phosphodiesterase/nucleotide pyrophosphatase [Bryobacterales bacterium]